MFFLISLLGHILYISFVFACLFLDITNTPGMNETHCCSCGSDPSADTRTWGGAGGGISTQTHRVRLALAHEDLGDAEVSDLDDHLVLVQQDVLGLEVAVQDQLVVHVVHGQQDLHEEVQDGVLVQQGVAALLDVVGQGSPCGTVAQLLGSPSS